MNHIGTLPPRIWITFAVTLNGACSSTMNYSSLCSTYTERESFCLKYIDHVRQIRLEMIACKLAQNPQLYIWLTEAAPNLSELWDTQKAQNTQYIFWDTQEAQNIVSQRSQYLKHINTNIIHTTNKLFWDTEEVLHPTFSMDGWHEQLDRETNPMRNPDVINKPRKNECEPRSRMKPDGE